MNNFGSLWAEIDLDKLAKNIRNIKALIDEDSLLTGVIKANGYGHGAVDIAETILENGADRLAIATVREGVELREAGFDVDILILGYTRDEDLPLVLEYDLTQTIFLLQQAEYLNKLAKEAGKIVKIHIKLDTGMSRIGFLKREDSIEDILEISKLENLEIEGIFTHFSTADSKDKTYTMKQVENFNYMVDKLEERCLQIPIKHVSNSAAIMDLPELNYDMVRAGIIQYGTYPSNEVDKSRLDLEPIMTIKTILSNVKELDEGTDIGYGRTYTTKGKEKIGTMPIGYADGFFRLLSNIGEVGIKGKRAKIAGNVCMDQTMINLEGIEDPEIADEIIIIGDGKNGPAIEEHADKIGTINYELETVVGRRIPRVYIKNGEVIKVVDYLAD